jgi:quercetin dioxygenase-like cupin family protein
MLEIQRVEESQAAAPPQPENFTGRVRMQNLAKKGGAGKVEMLAVYFDVGAHTRPHKHPSEQVLHFVRGSGFVWLAEEEPQRVPEGGIVVVPGEVVHMHGATEDEPICHIALRAADGETDWEPKNVPEDWQQYL